MTSSEEIGGSESANLLSNGNFDDDDDFGEFTDFQDASPVINNDEIPITSPRMSTSSSSNETISSITYQVTKASSPVETTSSTNGSISSLTIDNIVNQSFTKINQANEEELTKVIKSDLFINKTSQSYKMWQTLINLEEATSLKLNWESSHTFQIFLKSLNIDSQDILNNHIVPDFSLSSESEKLTKISKATKSIPKSVSSKMTPSKPCKPSSESPVPKSSTKKVLTKTTEIQQQNQSASNIPKANFDWNSSGLTNPLEDSQPANNQLDVTYFLNNPNFLQPCSSPKAPTKILEADSSQNLNESPPQPLSIISSSSTNPFHNLLSHIQNTSSSTKSMHSKHQTVRSEKNNILEELPLLSFMRTKLLMFPVGDSVKD